MKMQKLCAAIAFTTGLLMSPHARADNWGCEVLLCLSNPAGPMAVKECVPPITRLYKAIFKWKPDPFPTCVLSSGIDSKTAGGNYAHVAAPSYFDACPTGTTEVPRSTLVAKGRRMTPEEKINHPLANAGYPDIIPLSSHVVGIGDGEWQRSTGIDSSNISPKVCVSGFVGLGTITYPAVTWDDSPITYGVQVYERVVLLDPATDSFNINVFINGSLHNNIRPFSRNNIREF
jgi:hypothetical protein